MSGLVSKLCVEADTRRCDEIIGQLMEMLDTIHQMSTETLENLAMEQQLQFQNSAISLWNVAVAMNAGGTTSQLFLAKLRHLACNIAVISSLGNTNYDILKQHLCMTSKAASSWLDCETAAMADQCLNLAVQILDTLEVVTRPSAASNQKFDQRDVDWKGDLKREAFKVYLYKSRVCIMQDQHGDAANWVKRAKELLEFLPDESGLLAMHCFNFGTDALQREQYQACVDWLRESYELGKSNKPLEGSILAKILRLLAKAYMEWDPNQYAQKAINAVGLANAEHSHPSGLHLKVKIILQSVASDAKLQAAIDELWSHPELTLDLATDTVHLLTKHNKLNIAVKSCAELNKRFQSSSDACKLKVLHIELMVKNKQLTEARQILEQCIAGSSAVNFDPSSLRNLHSLLWDQAAIAYESNDFSSALVWYNFSYGFFTHYMEMESANLARLQRNRASCFLNLQQFKKAEEAVRDSVKHDPRNPYTHFLSFRVALCNNSPAQAIEAIKKLSDSKFENEADCSIEPAENPVVSLISLAAQQAFEQTNQEVAIEALEKLAEHAKDEKQLMTTYRCLIRLRCTLCEGKEDKDP
ncbi:Testis-expressed protein 11 [Holothuria leucospilota]|uniref:Protein ZIP4 homolog n=1 Tax=Holothuria leucospilota TaxID=206669 RepID=A0A9Q1GVT4_HOLLE|nr:Testis-expressed protein 11 [Holothuria leucospilota]